MCFQSDQMKGSSNGPMNISMFFLFLNKIFLLFNATEKYTHAVHISLSHWFAISVNKLAMMRTTVMFLMKNEEKKRINKKKTKRMNISQIFLLCKCRKTLI